MTRVVLATAVLAFASSVTAADTITVCLDGSCDYSNIQQAINAATDGDVIEIAAGTYYPAATIDTNGKAVTLRGVVGKAGSPTTVIDGQDSIRVLICESGEGADTVFESLLITGGYASGYGGGMRNHTGSSPTLTYCVFQENSAHSGGGMYNYDSSSPTLTDCAFTGNSATGGNGGGMYNYSSSSPTLTNCVFQENSANSRGGGMSNYVSSPTLENCTFTGNSSRGGGMSNNGSSPTLTNCSFEGNSSTSTGGGMYNASYSNPTLENCTLSGNLGKYGAGMCNDRSSPALTNCSFTGNSAEFYGGGMYNRDDSSPTLTGCTFTGNAADDYGGGMYNYLDSSPTLENCTFTECCQIVPPNSIIDKGGNDYESWCDECRANVDCVGEVDAADLGLLLSGWNTTEAQYDLDGDGVVGGGDLGAFLVAWGACP